MISFTSFQGQGVVTGSKHFLKVGNEYLLLDYGGWQGNQDLELKCKDYKCPINVNQIKAVLLSHAHYDHCGLLPLLVKEGYKNNIYCTSATRDLSSVVLMDSVKVSELFTEQDVIETLNHFRSHAYGKCKQLDDSIEYTAYNAGHILGSSVMSINLKDKGNFFQRLFKRESKEINVLYSGDLGRENNPIVYPPETDIPAPDYIIMESTYGNRLHEALLTSLKEFAGMINETIDRGGKVIIPSFAIERAQEIIYYLKVLMRKNLIPKVPVYVDSPMMATATGVFQIHPECFNNKIKDEFVVKGKNPFSVSSLHIIKDNQESLKIAKSKKPCIILSANGMCSAGRILNHIRYGIENYNNSIILVGYSSPGTLARELADGAEYIKLGEKELFVKASVATISAFSAHADYKEMLNWLKNIDTSKLKKIFLVHGQEDSQEFFKNFLIENGFKNIEIVEEGKEYKL